VQSHGMHFFHLAAPDLVLGFDADPAKATSINLSGGATLFTRPILKASMAPIGSPSMAISFAFAIPTIRHKGSNNGFNPNFNSGCPKMALSEAMIISQAVARLNSTPQGDSTDRRDDRLSAIHDLLQIPMMDLK